MDYIKMDHVVYKYQKGGFRLKEINLNISKEGFTAVCGRNGSGKTTIGKLAAGIFKPDEGYVHIDGRDSRNMTLGEIGLKVGYLFQNPDRQLFAPTVREEISFIMELNGSSREEIDKTIEASLNRFDLGHLKDAVTFKLSRGEKQRLALAAVLVNNPEYLILDEPTTGLDMERKKVLSDIIDGLLRQGTGMLVISHDMDFIMKHADRVVRVEEGGIADD